MPRLFVRILGVATAHSVRRGATDRFTHLRGDAQATLYAQTSGRDNLCLRGALSGVA